MNDRLGKGTFSKVFAVSDLESDNKKRAIKVIRNQRKYRVAARSESQILSKLKANDPNDA